MRTVYLDQNKWIDLARAATGHAQGARYAPVLVELRRARSEGRAQFPLSTVHYFETGRASDPQRRLDVATVMMEISGGVTIAPPHSIVPWELECALLDACGITGQPVPELEIFGRGAAHAFNEPAIGYRAPEVWEGVPLSDPTRTLLNATLGPAMELCILADQLPGVSDVPRLAFNDHKQANDAAFVAGQEQVRDYLATAGKHRLDDAMLGTAIGDILDLILRTCLRLKIDPLPLFDNPPLLAEILDKMPSRWVEMQLRRLRQSNPQKAWEGNDLNDVTALSIAVPYCDVVVTERMWAGMITQGNVASRFNTTVISKLDDLVDLLEP